MKFTAKIWKTGNSYVITVPSQYIKDGILYTDNEAVVSIEMLEKSVLPKSFKQKL